MASLSSCFFKPSMSFDAPLRKLTLPPGNFEFVLVPKDSSLTRWRSCPASMASALWRPLRPNSTSARWSDWALMRPSNDLRFLPVKKVDSRLTYNKSFVRTIEKMLRRDFFFQCCQLVHSLDIFCHKKLLTYVMSKHENTNHIGKLATLVFNNWNWI